MKIIKSIINVLTTLIIIFGVVFIGLYLFGITPYVVLSGSMEPNIKVGSVCFINKNVKYEKIKENDIIAFKFDDGVLVTHRVVRKNEKGLITKGDANKSEDTTAVTSTNYVGKNIFSIPKAGVVVKVIQSTTGKIVFGTVIVLMIAAGLLLGEDDKKPKTKKTTEETQEEKEE